jgi:hypothetical protein
MAVAVVIECKDATLDQYDQVLAKMGRTPRGRGAPGSLFHWVTATEDGIRVTDVWQTREQFETFAARRGSGRFMPLRWPRSGRPRQTGLHPQATTSFC